MEQITLANAKVGDTVIDTHRSGRELSGYDYPENPFYAVTDVDETHVYIKWSPRHIDRISKKAINPRFQLFDPLNVERHSKINDNYLRGISHYNIQEKMYKLTTTELMMLDKFLEDATSLHYFDSQHTNGL
jgi:hypothetical protein